MPYGRAAMNRKPKVAQNVVRALPEMARERMGA